MAILFNSTYKENLKRLKKDVEVGYIVIDDWDESSASKVASLIAKAPCDPKDVKVRKENVETDEYGHSEDRLVFYYEVDESEKAHKERIEDLELKDLKEFLQCLTDFNQAVRIKEDLRKLWKKHVIDGKRKTLAAYWQESYVDVFFSTQTVEELIAIAVDKERKESEKRIKDLKDNMRKAL